MRVSDNNDDDKVTITYTSSTQFAYTFGAGLLIQDTYTISLTYRNLGTQVVKKTQG
jgi:hypothetical protein